MMTEAWRRLRFSSCSALTLNLYVSSSTLRTLLCCCRDSILFWSCSRVTGDGGIIIGPPSIELESLSDALSRSAIFPRLFKSPKNAGLSCGADTRVSSEPRLRPCECVRAARPRPAPPRLACHPRLPPSCLTRCAWGTERWREGRDPRRTSAAARLRTLPVPPSRSRSPVAAVARRPDQLFASLSGADVQQEGGGAPGRQDESAEPGLSLERECGTGLWTPGGAARSRLGCGFAGAGDGGDGRTLRARPLADSW
jgi:hypothetical protein